MKTVYSLLPLIIGCCIICFGCKKQDRVPDIDYKNLYEEQLKQNTNLIDSIKLLNNNGRVLTDSIEYYKVKLNNSNIQKQMLVDSVAKYKEEAIVYKYKIERIKAYDKIVRNNSSQSKYFLGWVRRVIED